MSKNNLVSRFVSALFEGETTALFGLLKSPAGEDLGNFRDIFLRVTTVDTECVQFHQLASVILVQAIALALRLFRRWISLVIGTPPVFVCVPGNAVSDVGIRSHAEPVVEIEQHGGTLCCRLQQIFEL